jgi:A/G-specific adenine glycosylase
VSSFSTRIINWQRQFGRHGLPWQHADAYRVWLSEIMLQQTQVATVIPYYVRFVASFPNVATLAAASEDEVLAHWSGLGYYSRGRNLLRAARLIMQLHAGKFPQHFDDICALPGVGRSTAAAISALAFHQRRAILDGNVKRVLARYCAIPGYTGDKKIEAQLWQQAEAFLPDFSEPQLGEKAIKYGVTADSIASYTQGLMDLGAQLCTRGKPQCEVCPLEVDCAARVRGLVAQLPTPRPRKALPEKYSTFLLVLQGTDILLEKRPSKGIWGGLWSPLQFEDALTAWNWYAQMGGAAEKANRFSEERINPEDLANTGKVLPTFSHTFTHFKLHISPLLVRLAHRPSGMEGKDKRWIKVEEALLAGIPTPVRKMLQTVLELETLILA